MVRIRAFRYYRGGVNNFPEDQFNEFIQRLRITREQIINIAAGVARDKEVLYVCFNDEKEKEEDRT